MIIAVLAAALIIGLVVSQAAALSKLRTARPVPASAAAGPRVDFRSDPMGWVVDGLRRRQWMRRALSIGSIVAMLIAVVIIGRPFYTNLVQSRIQDRLSHQLSSPDLRAKYLAGRLAEGDSLTRIQMPAINVDVVVVQGTGDNALRAGAGHYTDTPYPCEQGNMAIAGHRTTYGRPFADLDLLRPGDQITLQTPIGSCTYQVMPSPSSRRPLDAKGAAFVIKPDEGWVLSDPPHARPGDPNPPPAMLTLTTCHPKGSASQRLVVQAVLVTPQTPTPAPQGGGA